MKMSAASKGRKATPETREASGGQDGAKAYTRTSGKTVNGTADARGASKSVGGDAPPEMRTKVSAAQLGRIPSPEARANQLAAMRSLRHGRSYRRPKRGNRRRQRHGQRCQPLKGREQ